MEIKICTIVTLVTDWDELRILDPIDNMPVLRGGKPLKTNGTKWLSRSVYRSNKRFYKH
jgi:hypothetical protein